MKKFVNASFSSWSYYSNAQNLPIFAHHHHRRPPPILQAWLGPGLRERWYKSLVEKGYRQDVSCDTGCLNTWNLSSVERIADRPKVRQTSVWNQNLTRRSHTHNSILLGQTDKVLVTEYAVIRLRALSAWLLLLDGGAACAIGYCLACPKL